MFSQRNKRAFAAASSATAVMRDLVQALEPRRLLSGVTLDHLGTYETGTFDEGGAEIIAHDPRTQRVFSVNGAANTIDILNISDPAHPTKVGAIDVTPYGAGAQSVAVRDGIVAVAIQNNDKVKRGNVSFFDTDGQFINSVKVGALPDMLTFTPEGRNVLVANEGEPDDAYKNDPEGSVSIIPVWMGVQSLTSDDVIRVGFNAFNSQKAELIASGVRIFGPRASVAEDLEPEYIAVSADSRTAWVTLQENNAIARIDIASAAVEKIIPLGFKDHSLPGNGIDASDRDGKINIQNWPVFGMYQPDAIAAVEFNGQTYLVTANEGDVREYTGFNELNRVRELKLDPTAFPNAAVLQNNANLGRLRVTNTLGDTDGDGDFDRLYAFGARSISVWTEDGQLVWDSGDQIEQITAQAFPGFFNASNTNNTFDDRSDDKGPEPEGLAVGKVGGEVYTFLGLERIGGAMVFNVSNPTSPSFVTYSNNRPFSGDPAAGTAGDLGPEGLLFIRKEYSPTGDDLLGVANEVSGSVSLFEVRTTAA
jgi:2',3'-cyclic-nucleotide 2'-phosphodiesterase / 3'-nucleotidase / 5'-nucleotidase